MPVLAKLIGEDFEALHLTAKGLFLHGQCYEFAIAMHRATGWPLVGLMKESTIEHAGVRSHNGLIHDCRGPNTPKDFSKEFDLSPDNIQNITEQDMYGTRKIYEGSIRLASRIAQSLWPELPWKPNTLHNRMIAFMEDLEKLSHDHNLWIRSAVPGCRPVISEGDNLEGGYFFSPTATASAYVMDRYLKSEIPKHNE
ncbi:MAG: hypothetical protein Q8R30_00275 [bacterium]|nr:hypothetical protein [bacterium]MDZ4286302.1 hypothetical protein [Candidatus Sungbacteria bacterium]